MTSTATTTIPAAALLLKVCERTVMSRCKDKTLKAWKGRGRGRPWVIDLASVMALKKQWEEGTE